MIIFWEQVLQTLWAISPLAFVGLASAFLCNRGILTDSTVKGLSDGVVYLFLPCLIFDKISSGLNPEEMPYWWTIPLIAVALILLGGTLSFLVFPHLVRKSPDILPLAFMQNAGYLIVALGQVLVPEQFDEFSALVFLYVLGHSPVLWSIGKYLITRSPNSVFRWRSLLTPPLVANLLAIGTVAGGIQPRIPYPLTYSIGFLGTAAVPLSLVVLGASLSTIQIRQNPDWAIVVKAVSLKLLIIPAVVFTTLFLTGIYERFPLLAFMLALQSTSPQAVNLMVHVRTYGGNIRRTGTVMMFSYLLSIFTIPLWVSLWKMMTG